MNCAACRFSEGEAVRREAGWALLLWCMARGGRALAPCVNFAPEEAAAACAPAEGEA